MARANQRGHVDSDAELGRAGDARTETIRTVATLWPPFHLYLRRQSRCSTLIPHRSQQSRSSHHSRSRSDLGSCVRLPQDVKLASGMRQQQGKGGEPADLELISAASPPGARLAERRQVLRQSGGGNVGGGGAAWTYDPTLGVHTGSNRALTRLDSRSHVHRCRCCCARRRRIHQPAPRSPFWRRRPRRRHARSLSRARWPRMLIPPVVQAFP